MASLASAGILMLAGACARPVPVIHKVEERRSPEHRFALKNETPSALTLLSTQPGGPGRTLIPSGGVAEIRLQVVELTDLEQAEESWFRRKAGATRYLAIPNSAVDMAGADAAFRIEFPGGAIETFRILLEACWFSGTPSATLRDVPIAGPPEEGPPSIHCEP
ncbi:MAG: hypothetical protein ACRDGN_10835 [bacterium]